MRNPVVIVRRARARIAHFRAQARLVRRARKGGAGYAWPILRHATDNAIDYALALALVEQESHFRNIFGCDHGPQGGRPPYCGEPVTKARVRRLIESGKNNGIGLTQLTDPSLRGRAQALGGAHRPAVQLHVGFAYLRHLMNAYGRDDGIGAYNGGPSNPQRDYSDNVQRLEAAWKVRLNR